MGTGHVMRCLALAQEWRAVKGDVVFLSSAPSAALLDRLKSEDMAVELCRESPGGDDDARVTVDLCKARQAGLLVVDGYHFGPRFQSLAKAGGAPQLLIDDGVLPPPFEADWVLNANLHATPEGYAGRSDRTNLLLGPKYALVRREFRKWGGWEREFPQKAGKILVALGGGDVRDAVVKVLGALKQCSFDKAPDVVIVAGFASAGMKDLEELAGAVSPRIRIQRHVGDMAALMAWADLAIAAAGSISWELAFMRVPSILLVLADNQAPIAASLHAARSAIGVGTVKELAPQRLADEVTGLATSPEKRRALADTGRKVVDGGGPARIIQAVDGAKEG